MSYNSDTLVKLCAEIKNDEIKELVLKTIPAIPDYFYIVPSSSSGKYHPSDENCGGGLVRHTIKVVKTVDVMSRMYNLSETKIDLAKAALILHDCCKNGPSKDNVYTMFLHPIFAAETLLFCNKNCSSRKQKKYRDLIYKLISSHMGRWNTDKYSKEKLPLPKTNLEKFVHECDYIASRKDFNIIVEEI